MIETHPFYKGGQTFFDLLEFKDSMLDGSQEGNTEALANLRDCVAKELRVPALAYRLPADLPPLEVGFFLYRDVALGVLSVLLDTRQLAACEPAP